jgi:hypothetical protein
MRNRLIPLAVLCGTLAGTTALKGETLMTMNVTLSGPATVRLAQIDPDDPGYDPVNADIALVFTNTSDRALHFPAEAIVQKVVRVYRDTATGLAQTFVVTGPPSDKAALTTLQPGESWTYGLWFEFPDQVLATDAKSWPLQICASWDQALLDRGLYPPGSYDWADGFQACLDVTVRR